jgi:hypothetical protein
VIGNLVLPLEMDFETTNFKEVLLLNIRPQTLKLIQERVGNTLEVIGIGKDFLNGTSSATKRKHTQMGPYKTKKLLLNKKNGL